MKIAFEDKQKYIRELEVDRIKAGLAEQTVQLIQKKKIVSALKESHRDLIFSKEAAKSKIVRGDEEFTLCKNEPQRQAYLGQKLIESGVETDLRASENGLNKAELELDIVQDNLKLLKYEARLVVAELQFMAD